MLKTNTRQAQEDRLILLTNDGLVAMQMSGAFVVCLERLIG